MADTTQPSPEAKALGNNLDAVAAAGHTNLNPLAQTAVAQGAGSTQSVVSHAGLINQATGQIKPEKSISEPAINHDPSLLQYAASFLHHQYGPIPVLTSDVASVQKGLQSKGYANGLPIGAWNTQWQQALNQHAYDVTTAPTVGNVKSLPLWEKVINEINPPGWSSTIVHSVANYIQHMPEMGRRLLSTAIGTGIIGESARLFGGASAQAKVESGVEQALGGNLTPQQAQQTEVQRHVAALGDLLGLVTLSGTGKAMATSIGDVGKSLLENTAAKESVPAAAKALVTRSLPESAAATPTFFVSKSLYQGGVEGAKGTGALRWMENIPVLKSMLPAIDAMDTPGSMYYKLAMQKASLMRNPIWQVAAQAQAKGSLAGLGLMGIGEVEQKAGINEQDANLAAPYQGTLANAVNGLSLFMGHPTIGLKATQNVGQVVDAAHGALSDALGPINMDYVLKKGLGISLSDLQKNLKHENVNDFFLNTKVNQYAAAHYADDLLSQAVSSGAVDRNSTEAVNLFKQYQRDAMKDPTGILAPARESLIRQPDVLANYFRKDFAGQLGANVRKGITESYDINDKNKERFYNAMRNLFSTKSDMSVLLSPEIRNLIHGSRVQASTEDLLSQALREDWGKRQTPFNALVKSKVEAQPVAEGSKAMVYQGKAMPPLYHVNRNVSEYMPDPASLESNTRFGKGIKATDDAAVAGRDHTNVYTLRYNPVNNEEPTFLDLTKAGQAPTVAAKLSALQKTGITRNELGLIGKTPKEYSPEYKTLAKMLKNKEDYSGSDILDAYRSALKAAARISPAEIDKRISDVTSAAMAADGHAGFKFINRAGNLNHVLNSERIIANMTQLDPSLTKDSLIPGYLKTHNVNEPGVIGLARNDTFIQQDAQKAAKAFFTRLNRAGYDQEVQQAQSTLQLEGRLLAKDPNFDLNAPLPKLDLQNLNKEGLNVLNEARGILIKKLGFDSLQVNKLDPIAAVSLIYRESHGLASEAFLPANAPKAAVDAVARLAQKGYRPVLGTDIGHAYEAPILHPVIADQRTSLLRRAALALKLDPSKVSDISVAQAQDTAVKERIDRGFASGQVQPFVGDNSSTIVNILRDYARSGAQINNTGNKLANAIRGWGQGRRDQLITQLMGDTSNLTVKEERELHNAAVAKANEILGSQRRMSDLGVSQMVKALTQPVAKGAKDYLSDVTPRYTKEDATKIAKWVLEGRAKAPGDTMGLGKAEDFIRASGAMATNATASFFGKVPLLKNYKIGEGPIASAITALPSNLTALRNQWRFDLNPIFAYRRLAKTNIKAATEGVPLSRNPYQAMTNLGIKDEAYSILGRTMPKVYAKAQELDTLDRFLQQNDVFGIYNPAHNMAWQAYHLKQLGLSDAEITQKLEKINTYGDRTPLERTVNTIFYPFSFNKTLYKNIGGYLLDHPGENALLNAGFQLYNHLDPKNQEPGNGLQAWFNKHLPLIQDFQKLNAFEHGTGLGQFGGINAPYVQQLPYIKEFMNLFSPQAITPAAAPSALKTLTNMVPALNELNGLLFNVNLNTGAAQTGGIGSGRLVETGKVGYWVAKNLVEHSVDLYKHFTGKPVTRAFYQTTLPESAQIQAGVDAVTSLKAQLSSLIGSGQVWPSKPGVPKDVWGLPYNATSFELYAHALYPAYTPGAGAGIALQKQDQALTFVQRLQGTFRYDAYSQFNNIAKSAVAKLAKITDGNSIQKIATPLRQLAVNIAEQDPKFTAFYNKFYESALGPIEGFTK